MKLKKIGGIICGLLAVCLAALGIWGHTMQMGSGSALFQEAQKASAYIDTLGTLADKTLPSAVKKVSTALSAAQDARDTIQKASDNVARTVENYYAGSTGDASVDAALSAGMALSAVDSILVADNVKLLLSSAEEYLYTLLNAEFESAEKSLSGAITKYDTACKGLREVYASMDTEYTVQSSELPEFAAFRSETDYAEALNVLSSSAEELESSCEKLNDDIENASALVSKETERCSLSLGQKVVALIGSSPIGFVFTAVLFLALALVLTVWNRGFLRLWKNVPVFSTFIALLVLLIIQVYALGFSALNYGDWGMYWLKNLLNVLRSNSSVGMIALGMTFVIISGGMDLAVGSNLAGIATVVMVLLDTSSNGFLTGLGVTGLPNYIIAILAGLLTATVIGLLTGLGVTKGRIPPFILTLGIMNIVRSVAQYFTKSYKPEVPKAFQVLANAEVIGDQMLLPIIYWLVLAVIMHIVANHTAFGRHVYAVGSNEKASRLSGIHVDRVKIAVYVITSVIVAIAAITSVARLRGLDVASAGSGYEMNAIAAVVVGGTSMSGGKGSILGTLFGTLMIGIMSNLLVLVGIDAFLSNAFTGAIIVFAVLIQRKDK